MPRLYAVAIAAIAIDIAIAAIGIDIDIAAIFCS
jgi:hypothetical protein